MIQAALLTAIGTLMLLAGGIAAAAERDRHLAPELRSGDLKPMHPNLDDKPSLQRGMALYMNYCLGCHSLKFQRYERTADDLDIPHQVALDNLIFTGQAIGGLMRTAMPPQSAKSWFGAPPPDLTMVDRVRGTAWIYNMLLNFYADPSRPFGVNNRVFKDIGMPHVLAGLQGVPRLAENRFRPLNMMASTLENGAFVAAEGNRRRFVPKRQQNRIEIVPESGSMTEQEYQRAVYDIANFLHYVGEPGRQRRQQIGIWVLAFLAGLFVLATLLNREYWKDVH